MTRVLKHGVFALGCVVLSCASVAAQVDPHAGHQQATPPPSTGTNQPLPPFIPPLTDEDRQAAFPDVDGHSTHERGLHYFVLIDQLEWQTGNGANRWSLDTRSWVGRDRDRLWLRAEGDGTDEGVGDAYVDVLFGRQLSTWWDVVGGIRQDWRAAPEGTWAAIGIQGLAPYWFDVEATAYFGGSGRTQFRFEVEYTMRLTNRLILQPLFEADVFGKADPDRGVGAGLSSTETGLRLRYEWRREFAPYLGVSWDHRWGGTADVARAEGDSRSAAQVVAGARLWF